MFASGDGAPAGSGSYGRVVTGVGRCGLAGCSAEVLPGLGESLAYDSRESGRQVLAEVAEGTAQLGSRLRRLTIDGQLFDEIVVSIST